MLDETGLSAEFVEVCPLSKRILHSDEDYLAIHPLGLTPSLITRDGELISENMAVLSYITEISGRTPKDPMQRIQLIQWLSFVAAEIHRALFTPFFDRIANEGAKAHALVLAKRRFEYLDAVLKDRAYVFGNEFSAVDAYLVTLLHAAQATPIDLSSYPNVDAYLKRHLDRPSVSSAIALELPLFKEELKRAKRRKASTS